MPESNARYPELVREPSDWIAGGPAPHGNPPRWDHKRCNSVRRNFFDGGCTRLPEVDGYYQRTTHWNSILRSAHRLHQIDRISPGNWAAKPAGNHHAAHLPRVPDRIRMLEARGTPDFESLLRGVVRLRLMCSMPGIQPGRPSTMIEGR